MRADAVCRFSSGAALRQAGKVGIIVARPGQAGSGRVFRGSRAWKIGAIAADKLNPKQARPLPARAYAPKRMAHMFKPVERP